MTGQQVLACTLTQYDISIPERHLSELLQMDVVPTVWY